MPTNDTREDSSQDVNWSTGRASDWLFANRSNWTRGLLMLVFFIVFWLIKFLIGFIALFQFGSLLFTGSPNRPLRQRTRAFSFHRMAASRREKRRGSDRLTLHPEGDRWLSTSSAAPVTASVDSLNRAVRTKPF